MDADVGVHGERRGDEPDLVDEVAEPAGEPVVDLGEPAEAREPDDLQARAVALGRDLADQPLEVVLAAVERAGEAVERDALDRRAERRRSCRHRLHGLGVVLLDVEHLVLADDDVGDVQREVDVDPVLGVAGLDGYLARQHGGVGREPPLAGLVDQLVEPEGRGRSWSSAASPPRPARRRCGGPRRRCTSRAGPGTTGCGPRPRRGGRRS